MTNQEALEALKEMMDAWNKIIKTIKQQFPNSSSEEIYQIAKGAMDHAIRIIP